MKRSACPPFYNLRLREDTAPRGSNRCRAAKGILFVRSRTRWLGVALGFAVAAVVLFDLYGPQRGHLADFDPTVAARLEAAMWRSRQSGDDGTLFRLTAERLRAQFHLPFLRSYSAAYALARAAYLFDRGRARSEYERVVPHMTSYFAAIDRVNRAGFEPARVARLELEWWIVRRQRSERPPEDLEIAIAAVDGALYGVPTEMLQSHAQLRAEALAVRDAGTSVGGVEAVDWRQVEELLRQSWVALQEAVRP